MPFDDQFWRAVADYALQFPDLASVTTATPWDKWLAEYSRVRATAFASVLITANNAEGGSASGRQQFPQETLIDALHARRWELDNTYVLPAHLFSYASALIRRRQADNPLVIQFGQPGYTF